MMKIIIATPTTIIIIIETSHKIYGITPALEFLLIIVIGLGLQICEKDICIDVFLYKTSFLVLKPY